MKNAWWGTTPCTWNFGPNWPHSFKNANFKLIFSHSASAVRPSDKVRLSLIGSPLRAFQWAQDERHMLLGPQRWGGGLKNANGCFPSKRALLSKKVCYEASLCANHQQHSCKAFAYLSVELEHFSRFWPQRCNCFVTEHKRQNHNVCLYERFPIFTLCFIFKNALCYCNDNFVKSYLIFEIFGLLESLLHFIQSNI